MKHALENTKRQDPPSGCVTASFFFDGRRIPIPKTPTSLCRSLLHQLLAQIPPLPSEPHSISKEKRETKVILGKGWVWRERELQYFPESALPNISKEYQMRIYVDALDECSEKDAQDLVRFSQRLTPVSLPSAYASLVDITLSWRRSTVSKSVLKSKIAMTSKPT